MGMTNCWKGVLFFFAFTAAAFGAEVKRDVSNFRNVTEYFSFLDDVFNNLNSSPNTSEKCRSDVSLLLRRASDGDVNALKIFDSAGKPSSGILEGGVFFIGFYSECVNSFINVSQTERILGQYCLVNFNFSASKQQFLPQVSWKVIQQSQKHPTIGICIPSSCSSSDLNTATSLSLRDHFEGVQGDVAVCHRNPSGFSKDTRAQVILSVVVIELIISIIGTAIDIIDERKKYSASAKKAAINAKSTSREVLCEDTESKPDKRNIIIECFLAFSFRRNFKKIISVEESSASIACLHGLRFLSMALIILGHTFSFATQNLFIRNPGAAGQAPKDFISQIFANGTLAVDSFYTLSGILVSFVTLKTMVITDGRLPLLKFYFHRYFRLTPLLLMVVMICAYLIRYLGSGPNWMASIMMYDEWCKENGYLNVLYLQNFINTEHMCLSHSWYLATDMQFYLVVPAILIPLYKNIKYGTLVSFIFLLATTVTTAVLTVVNHYPAIPYINDAVPQNIVDSYYKNVYIKPYCRMGPYLIGIHVGYLLLHKKELPLKKITSIVLWTVSVTLGLTIIYLMWPANLGHIPTDSQAAAYSALARTLWSLCIGWLVIACNYGYGGVVNSILSWKPLVPLSRLTYCAYLIHPVVMNMYYGSIEFLVDYSVGFVLYLFLGNICITFVLSLILSLMFESPFVALERVIFRARS